MTSATRRPTPPSEPAARPISGRSWGRLSLFWMPGNTGIETVPCAHCHNLTVGPVAVEWAKRAKPQPPEWHGVWQ